mmetsp:Transcript_36579/g.117570  ORF Transcript_36579/g.117570 Transcript_36579/m.117570 type:complete len:822 (+) Transcript_36579:126-2591(+)
MAEEQPSQIAREDVHALLEAGVSLDRLLRIRPHDLEEKQLQDIAKAWFSSGSGQAPQYSLDVAKAVLARSTSALQSPAFCDRLLEGLEEDVPEELRDPVSYTLMTDPVVLSSGTVVDRSTALNECGELRFHNCPFTRERLKTDVYPLLFLKARLVEFAKKRIEHIFTVAKTAMAEDGSGREPDLDTAARAVDGGCTFLKEVGRHTYANEAKSLNELRLRILEMRNEPEVKPWAEAYGELIASAQLAGGSGDAAKLALEAAAATFLARAEALLDAARGAAAPVDAVFAEAWLEALCRLAEGVRKAHKQSASGEPPALNPASLLKVCQLLLSVGKASKDETRIAQARAAVFFALQRSVAEQYEVDAFLDAENVRKVDVEELVMVREPDLRVRQMQDTASSDDWKLLGELKCGEDQVSALTVGCSWCDQGWGNAKGQLRVRLQRDKLATALDGFWKFAEMHIHVMWGRFAVGGTEIQLDDGSEPISFTWPDGSRQVLVSMDGDKLTWSRDASVVEWIRSSEVQLPARGATRKGASDRIYCGRSVGSALYYDGPSRSCGAGRPCLCDGDCGPTNGCQCAECYMETFGGKWETLFCDCLFGTYGHPERNAEAAVSRTFDASSPLLQAMRPGDTCRFEYLVGGGGGHTLRVDNFVASWTVLPSSSSSSAEASEAGARVALPPDWLTSALGLKQASDEVEYTDTDGDTICFRIEEGALIKYVNGERRVGSDDRSGIVTRLRASHGLRVDDQGGWGGQTTREVMEQLAVLADRAGVPHNILVEAGGGLEPSDSSSSDDDSAGIADSVPGMGYFMDGSGSDDSNFDFDMG